MGIFSRKKEVGLEEFCSDFYKNQILHPIIGKVDAGDIYLEVVKKSIVEVEPKFIDIDLQKLKKELIILRFELFALAWMHKFISGKIIVAQSAFTKLFLQENGSDYIWTGMEDYNRIIDGATLHWLSNLGKMNLSFNYNMREDLTAKNIKDANELGINDESIERANNRLWSENAWRQNIIIGPIVATFCSHLNLYPDDINKEALLRLSFVIRGLYDGAKQALDKVRIKA